MTLATQRKKVFGVDRRCCCTLGLLRSTFLWIGGPVIPYAKLDSLAVGMTKAQVKAILGEPAEMTSDGHWIYDRPPNPGWVKVYFDELGRFAGINDESPIPPPLN